MKKAILILMLAGLSAAAQVKDSIHITGQLKGKDASGKVTIMAFAMGPQLVGNVTMKDGGFKISGLLQEMRPGIYRLQYGQGNSFIDVIVSGKENAISFSLDTDATDPLPVFSQSESNKKWYTYQKQSRLQVRKAAVLYQALLAYPESSDAIVKTMTEAALQEKKRYQELFNAFVRQNPNTWEGDMVANKPYYFPNLAQTTAQQKAGQRAQYWNGLNTTSPALIYSPLYTEQMLEYVRPYINPEAPLSALDTEEGLKRSTDTIMARFGGNEETRAFALQFLTLGFKQLGQEKVLQYLDEKYAAQCTGGQDKAELDKRMAGYMAMKPGMQAPEIEWSANKGLKDIPSDKVIVIFWASWCPHCMQTMPKVEAWAKAHPNTKILAVSLDDDAAAHQKAIAAFPSLLHYSDYKKWKSEAAKNYHIVATPSFIALDKDRKIIEKYESWEPLKQLLEQGSPISTP